MKKSSRKTKRKGTVAVKVIAPKKFANGGAMSFDFDDTLSTDLGLQMAKSNPSSNKYVISARSEVTPDMIARARQAGIPDSNIFATGSDEAKVAKIQELGIKKHLDNKKSVIDRLGFKGQLFENGGNKKGNPPYKSPVQIVPYYSFNQPTTPEEWVKSIDQIEKIIGNPSTWTQDDYNIYQNKLNEYKIWRETTPEGQAVVDSSKRPNEYVIPLPTQLSTYLTSEQNRILQENPELQFIPKSKFAFGMPGAYGVTDEVGYAYGGYSGLFRYADGGTEGEPIENPPIYTWEGDPNSYYRKDEKGNWRYLNKDTESDFASGLYAFDKVRNRKVKKKLDAEAVLNPNAEAVLNQWGNTLPTPEISEVTLGRKETRKERKEREARYQAMTPEERRIFDQRKEQMKEEMWRRDNPNLLANALFNDPSNMTSEQLRQMAYKVPFTEAQKWLDMAEVQARREGELRTNKREKDYFQMGMGTMHGGDYLAPGETYASTYNKLYNFKTSEELPYAYAGTDKSGNIQLMTQEQKAKNDAQLAQITAVNEALKNRALIEQIEGRKLTDKDIYGEDGNYSPNLAKYSTQSYLQKIDDQKYQNFLAENQKAADEAGILYNSMDFLRNLAVNFPSTTINLLEGKMPLFQQGLGLRSEDPELRAMYEGYMPAGGTDADYWFNFINPVASLQDAKISYDLGNYGDAALAGLGALPFIGAVGKGTARGVGILDDAYRAAMSKSDEFARSFNLVDEAPVTSSTFTQSADEFTSLSDDYIQRYKLAEELVNEGLIPADTDLVKLANNPELLKTTTQSAIKKANTTYRATDPNKIREANIENMKSLGYDVNDPMQVAQYQATHISATPASSYKRAGASMIPDFQDVIYTGNYSNLDDAKAALGQYGDYITELRPSMDFSSGTPKSWLENYYYNRMFTNVKDPESTFGLINNPDAKIGYEGLGRGYKTGTILGDQFQEYVGYIGNRGQQVLQPVRTVKFNPLTGEEIITSESNLLNKDTSDANISNLPIEGEVIIHPFTGKPTPIETISSEIDYFQAADGLPYEAARGSEQWKILSNDPRFKYIRTSNIPSVVIDSPLSLGEDLYDARKLAIPLSEIEQYRITGDTSGNSNTTTSGLTSTSNLSEPVFFKPKKGVEGIIDTVKYIFDEVKFGKKNIKYKLDNYSNIKNTPKLYKDEISKLFTPEGISRLKDLGVDDIDDFMNFMDKAVSSTSLRDKTKGGSKTVNKEEIPYINVNFKEIKDILKSGKLKEEDLRSVIAHEIGHNIQSYLDTINKTFSGKSGLDVDGILELLPFVKENVSDFLSKSVGMTEEQAEDLAKKMVSENKEVPNASYYFTGSFGREPLAHLRELKQTMQNRGVIKNIHDKVTMDDIHNFYTYYDGYNDRILSFLKPSNAAFSAIASLLNKTPGLVPYVIGAGAAGEGINQMSNDNEKMYGGIQKNKYIGLFR